MWPLWTPQPAAGRPRCGNCHQPLPWIVDAGDDDFVEIAERATIPVLVDLWATWCGPCRMVGPALAQLAEEKAGKLKLVKVGTDRAAPALSERFTVRAVPTLLALKEGQVVALQACAAPVPQLRSWLDSVLAGRGEEART